MKNLLLFIFMTGCISANAQFEVYTHNFNSDGIENWTLVDNDGDSQNWSLKINDYRINMGSGATFSVLGSPYLGSVSLTSNWAITPAQDLSFYSGTKLNITYLKGTLECEDVDDLQIYAGPTPNVANMLATGLIGTIILEGDSSDPPVRVTKSIDIPSGFNLSTVYFAIVHQSAPGDPFSSNWAVELTNVSISAQDVLGVKDAAGKTATKIKQNPVAETLQLQLGSAVNPEALNLQIYNVSGMLVKEAKYSEAGISVSELAGGMYFALINNGTATERLKFIKK